MDEIEKQIRTITRMAQHIHKTRFTYGKLIY